MPLPRIFVTALAIITLFHCCCHASPVHEESELLDNYRKPSSATRRRGRYKTHPRVRTVDTEAVQHHSHGYSERDNAATAHVRTRGPSKPSHEESGYRKFVRNEEIKTRDWRKEKDAENEREEPDRQIRRTGREHQETSLAEDIINGIGRIFGMKGSKKPSSNATGASEMIPTTDVERKAVELAEVAREDKDNDVNTQFDDLSVPPPDAYTGAMNGKGERKGDLIAGEKEGGEDEEEVGRGQAEGMEKTNDAERLGEEAEKKNGAGGVEGKEVDEVMSDADLLEMVKLFRKFFSSAERALKEGHNRAAASKETGKPERKENEDDDERVSTWGFSRHKTKDKLPDVHVALAEAETLNRQRERERQAKFNEEGMEEGGTEKGGTEKGGTENLRLSVQSRVAEGLNQDEDLAADEEENGMPIKDLPKSSPSYGSRKKLLKSENNIEKGGKTLTEWLLEGIQTML